MGKVVPPVDPDLKLNGSELRDVRREDIEFELLKTEASVLKHNAREVGQRYIIKWIAVSAGSLVIAGMFLMLWHFAHAVFWGPFAFASPAFTVAMVVAPVFSVTTITVALFVGAFGRFKEKDIDTLKGGVPSVLDKFGGS